MKSSPSFSYTTFSPPRKNTISSYVLTLAFAVLIVVIYSLDINCVLLNHFQASKKIAKDHLQEEEIELPFALGRSEQGCDVFKGKWVYDEESRPFYEEHECSFLQPQLTCQAHGRPDKKYQHWRWQPHGCSLPSFNATFMLEKLRGKRLLYVGDSLNRGQFLSMVCLLQKAIPDANTKTIESVGQLNIFRAKDYNASIEFYWAPFLVESNSDNPILHRDFDKIVRLGSVKKHAQYWKGADILVFNTFLWWKTSAKTNILHGSFKDEVKHIEQMEPEDAYKLALKTMVKWVKKNVDPHKTRVFFTSMSPLHESSAEWGGEVGGNCYNQTTPIEDPNYWGYMSKKNMMQATGEVLGQARLPTITLLNITQLSEYRKDAHTSIYKKYWIPVPPEKLGNPKSYADCVHWCLPGLPDTWNELLYTKLFFP